MASRVSNNGYSSAQDSPDTALDYLYGVNQLSSTPSQTAQNYGASSAGLINQIPVVGKYLGVGLDYIINAFGGDTSFDDAQRTRKLSTDAQQLAIQLQRENNANELFNTYVANQMEKERADEYNANMLKLQNQANQFNIEQWNRANEYNAPKAVLDRYAQAGINPNFVFGQTSNVQPVTQNGVPDQSRAGVAKANFSAPKVFEPRDYRNKNHADMSTLISSMISNFVKIPEYQLAQAQIRKMNADAEGQELLNEGKKNANNIYSNNNLYVNSNDASDVIGLSEFNALPEVEKSKYEVVKFGFRSQEGYEAFKDVMRLKNTLKDIQADDIENTIRIKQSRIKEEAADMQLSDPERKAVIAIADLPWQQYRQLLGAANKAIHDGSQAWLKKQDDAADADIDYKKRLKQKLDDDDEWQKNHDMKTIITNICKNGINWENVLDAITTLIIAKAGL